jgi:hypothetical protein
MMSSTCSMPMLSRIISGRTQDCSRTYGGALGLAEIRRLDADGFEQHVEAVLQPGLSWPGHRLHTLNRAGRLECIDGSRLAPKL